MSTMIERVARAICEEEWGEHTWSLVSNSYRRKALNHAKAAIAAMRAPTPEMERAVAAQWGHRTWSQYGEAIDAALKETA